jgi:riboflavin kinase/FMN adenylyltransferase
MDIIHFPDDPRPPWLLHPVLALRRSARGHLKIIERVRRGAAEHGGTPMAMTFDPHPSRVLRPDKAPPLLMTKAQRLEALDRAGIGCVAVVRFTHDLSEWDPETFVRKVLVDWLRVSEVVVQFSVWSPPQRQLHRAAYAK